MWFGIHLVRTKRISAEQLFEAVTRQLEDQVQIGNLAVKNGLMALSDVECVLMEQANAQKPFGQVAVDNGYLSEQSLAALLMEQAETEDPIDEILIRMGYLTKETAATAIKEFRSRMHDTFDDAHDDAALFAAASANSGEK